MERNSPTQPRMAVGAQPGRGREVAIAELRGLGGVVLEQALVDGVGTPLPSLVAWGNRLADELGVDGLGRPGTYRELMRGVASINRRAGAVPG